MKGFAVIVLLLSCSALLAQRKKMIMYDTLGQVTTYELHFAPVVVGTHKSFYDRAANKRVLVKMPKDEFEKELKKTEKRIPEERMFGHDMPDFDMIDVNNRRLTKNTLAGKVAVLNFWFIGCAPCEMERPALNILREKYSDRNDVVFISIARDSLDAVNAFLKDNAIKYDVFPAGKDYIKNTFQISEFPVNVVVDKKGKYSFFGTGSGIGIVNIMQKQINAALAVE